MTSMNNIPDPAHTESKDAPPALTVESLERAQISGTMGQGKSWHLKGRLIKEINENKILPTGPEDEETGLVTEEEWHSIRTTEATSKNLMALTKAARSHPPRPNQSR